MLERQEKKLQFFPPTTGNILTLKKATLKHYCEQLPEFNVLLTQLKERGFFNNAEECNFSINDLIKNYPNQYLTMPLFELLTRPLPRIEFPEPQELPGEFKSIETSIDCYVEILVDVLHNELAQKPYEKVCDQENVTEQEHALQAGKIAALIGMPIDEILALLFHDIARPTINDPIHGHKNHCLEGSIILAPLGLSTDYSRYHSYAKYLLYNFNNPYLKLISNTSVNTLALQSTNVAEQGKELDQLETVLLAKTLYKTMFMRLIDDCSKAPHLELKKLAQDEKITYFDAELIKKMLKTQMINHLNYLSNEGKNFEQIKPEIENKLAEAFPLLLRAKESSNDLQLYEKYEDIIKAFFKRESKILGY